jgi:pyruvate/2-oxoglutarate dehydrogenase complex dihydrolipoamide dehydrogenase (E3) component
MVAENLARKVSLHPATNPVSIEKLPSGEFNFTYKGKDGQHSAVVVDQVMMATGRTPRTANLGLEVRCSRTLCTCTPP